MIVLDDLKKHELTVATAGVATNRHNVYTAEALKELVASSDLPLEFRDGKLILHMVIRPSALAQAIHDGKLIPIIRKGEIVSDFS